MSDLYNKKYDKNIARHAGYTFVSWPNPNYDTTDVYTGSFCAFVQPMKHDVTV